MIKGINNIFIKVINMDKETEKIIDGINEGLKNIERQMQDLREENIRLQLENEQLKKEKESLLNLTEILTTKNKG